MARNHDDLSHVGPELAGARAGSGSTRSHSQRYEFRVYARSELPVYVVSAAFPQLRTAVLSLPFPFLRSGDRRVII